MNGSEQNNRKQHKKAANRCDYRNANQIWANCFHVCSGLTTTTAVVLNAWSGGNALQAF